MGISFYTFQILAFVIDRRKAGQGPPGAVDYLNFASFFPQIVAGPIERGRDLLPQVKRLKFCLSRKAVESGLSWVVLGLFFKLALAENFALLDEELNSASANAVKIWAEAGFFACRIYFDFAGYSFIALGLARFFGIELTLNFRSPYLCRNLQEFWRSWHVTLSRWFRDYVYIPLGGSRTKNRWLTVMAVFGVSGLWHGAGWNFVVWGLLHGAGVLACVLLGKRQLPKFIAWMLTMGFVLLTWLFFKESDFWVTVAKLQLLANPEAYQLNLAGFVGMFDSAKSMILMAMMLGLTSLVFAGEWWSLRRSGMPYDLLLNRWIQLGLITGIFFLAPTSESSFIYFNF
ncbi:MBOAT family protein [Akkermansiaceae bacterium]|nr:MBOAT family protein [Akkermansiaceae bacterium]